MATASGISRNIFAMVDCSSYRDYDFNHNTSHQYYRMSPSVADHRVRYEQKRTASMLFEERQPETRTKTENA